MKIFSNYKALDEFSTISTKVFNNLDLLLLKTQNLSAKYGKNHC